MSPELLGALSGFVAALVAAGFGAWITYGYAVKLAERSEQRVAEGIRRQLRVVLREVYEFILNRREGQASPNYEFPGWEDSLDMLASRAYAVEMWTALGDQGKVIYDAAIAAKDTMRLTERVMAEKPVTAAEVDEVWSQAWIAVALITKARVSLGDTIPEFERKLIRDGLASYGHESLEAE